MKIKDLFLLLRVNQWYKNLVIFLAIFFSGNMLNLDYFYLTMLGFVSLCFVSSANYILNDLFDAKRDRNHAEKSNRPIPSGRVSKEIAFFMSMFFLFLSLFIAYNLTILFFSVVLLLFILGFAYSIFFRNEAFLDILLIAVNFVLRAVGGAVIINVWASPWLILCPFFLSLFLSLGKRKADILFLGKRAFFYKETLKHYTSEITDALLIMVSSILVICFSLYSFLSNHAALLIALPFVLYSLFRYLSMIYSGSSIARSPEKVFFDFRLLLTMTIILVITVTVVYLGSFSLVSRLL